MERTFLVCYVSSGWKWRSEKEMPQKVEIVLSCEEKATEAVFSSKVKSYTSCSYPVILSWSLIEE